MEASNKLAVGQRHGHLELIEIIDTNNPNIQSTMVVCRCDCGNISWVQTGHLTHGRTKNCGCGRKLDAGRASRNRVLAQYKRQARERNLTWRLTDEEFDRLTQRSCFFCGQKPVNRTRHKYANGDFVYNGIDRIDNAVGYIMPNIVPCCKFCNRAKGTGTVEEFLEWIEGLMTK